MTDSNNYILKTIKYITDNIKKTYLVVNWNI